MGIELSAFEKEMEEKLLNMKAEITGKISKADDDFRNVVGSSGRDSADLATDDMATKKMEAISQLDSNRLKACDQALARIHNGKYGYCAMCGKKIPEERLRTIPYALLCVECKKASEK